MMAKGLKMTRSNTWGRLARLGMLSLALAAVGSAATDARTILCDKPCTVQLLAAKGTIDVRIPTASAILKTLYKTGDQFQLEGNQEYVLSFNESAEGFFSFNLQFVPAGGNPVWSCRVRTIAVEPFISVDQGTWMGSGCQVTVNTDRTKPIIKLEGGS
jgi:hypothetical protein